MDYLSGGSVYDIMQHSFPTGLTDEVLISTILREALKGIEYLHSTGRIHRDVKAGNLLVHDDGSVKVGDFGVSAWLIEAGMKREGRQTFVGTPCWMAPEVMEQVCGYDYKADIWSLGITALELAHGQAPLAKYPPMKVLLLTLQNPPPALKGVSFSKNFHNFVEACLQKDPSKRPSATQLLEHKFLKQGKRADYVKQHLLKNLQPLWERVSLDIKLPFDEDDEPSSGGTSWNFESNGELLETIVSQSNTPQGGSPVSTLSSSNKEVASNTLGASDSTQKVNQVVKGRFTKTVISKVSNPLLPITHEKGDQEDSTEHERPAGSRWSATIDPLYLMGELNKQVQAIMKENELLKAENIALKKELQASRARGPT
eukprot:CAMPEP_0117002620 /NCGR_PEP_ID=MMETSP0472-20121206/4222_1 /TAXON_ID=693140 ORGANISM="Tiarina fusus, Strain LIS" /NCGR_SAMPLE_ID=MMETSP0472 /ASSEMBLY_ACC=CAM_ASM_000603 /LENGTH=370 /DNA_ID=CAMNT_0004703015 /DNA_START=255 /DNA_END=1367 /DNA_ORIENTATION=+